MAIYNKPDENVFASSAKQGEVSNFPDIGRGWGVSFDQTGGIPPMEWFNFLFKRNDEKFGYLFQRGLSEWSATQSYPEGALVQYKNLTYKAKRANTNKTPDEAQSSDWQRWGFTQSELKNATLTESGIAQLLTSVDSDDETKSATPKSVKMAYDKGVKADNNADGRVSKLGDTMTGPLLIKAGNYSSVTTFNNDGHAVRWESSPTSEGNFASVVYAENNGNYQYKVRFPRKSGEVLLDQGDKTINGRFYFENENSWIGVKSTSSKEVGFDLTTTNGSYPQVSIRANDVGGYSTDLRFFATPSGSNFNSDRRVNVATASGNGDFWVKNYGWLHDFFAKKNDINNVWGELNNTYRKNRFRHQYYPHHYNGAEVFDIPVADNGVMRVIVMNVTINGHARVNLPEAYNGSCMVQATDVGGGRKVVGTNIQNGNVIEIHNGGEVGLNILTIGWFGW